GPDTCRERTAGRELAGLEPSGSDPGSRNGGSPVKRMHAEVDHAAAPPDPRSFAVRSLAAGSRSHRRLRSWDASRMGQLCAPATRMRLAVHAGRVNTARVVMKVTSFFRRAVVAGLSL